MNDLPPNDKLGKRHKQHSDWRRQPGHDVPDEPFSGISDPSGNGMSPEAEAQDRRRQAEEVVQGVADSCGMPVPKPFSRDIAEQLWATGLGNLDLAVDWLHRVLQEHDRVHGTNLAGDKP